MLHSGFECKLQQNTQILKRRFFLATILALASAVGATLAATRSSSAPRTVNCSQPSAAATLITRILPERASVFVCELIPTAKGHDVCAIETRDSKIVLRDCYYPRWWRLANQYMSK